MTITYHKEPDQGSIQWHQARKGVITSSAICKFVTLTETPDWDDYPDLLTNMDQVGEALVAVGLVAKMAKEKADQQAGRLIDANPDAHIKSVIAQQAKDNPQLRGKAIDDPAHFYQLLSERTRPHLEENFEGLDMMRGKYDEDIARNIYSETYHNVEECGFITNTKHGFKLGMSPDGLVGVDGGIEIKSRRNGIQTRVIMEDLIEGRVPKEDLLQVQSSLLISGRSWWDYVLYSGGQPMAKVRAYPDKELHKKIIKICKAVDKRLTEETERYLEFISQFPPTEYAPFTTDIQV